MGANSDLRTLLGRGLEALGLPLPAPQVETLLGYLDLLVRWNAAYNLTAVREPVQMVPRHLLDSLAIRRWVRGPRLLDVGTGPGLPGIPLAIADPDLQVVLLDANGKKVRFCRQAALELGLRNVEVVQARIEAYAPAEPFDTLTARAVAHLPSLLASVDHLLRPSTTLLAMKGALPVKEVGVLREQGLVVTPHRLDVPGVGGERHLIEVRRSTSEIAGTP
jgi:16S rRNA (guanine527-N7)-methyltransferase